jgi:hypothetical protein
MQVMQVGWKDPEWMELAYGCDQWRTLALAVMNFGVLLPESQLISEIKL